MGPIRGARGVGPGGAPSGAIACGEGFRTWETRRRWPGAVFFTIREAMRSNITRGVILEAKNVTILLIGGMRVNSKENEGGQSKKQP